MLLIEQLKNTTNLTSSEQIVADYIVENPKSVITLTSTEVAQLTFSSQSNVIRLCKKLGLSGFSNLKLQLASELNTFSLKNQRIESNYPFTINDNVEDILKNILNLNYQTLTDTYNTINHTTLQKISSILFNATSTSIYATGESLILAEEFHYKLMRIGIPTSLEAPNGFQITKCRTLKQGDVALIISYYDMSEEKIAICKTLKHIGIPIILLTGNRPNPLLIYADEIIKIHISEDRSKMAPLASRTAMQFILDSIFSIIFSLNYANHMDTITKNEILRDVSK